MTNNITQVGLIKIRRGKAEQLPYALEEGEFGLATDTLELFIGAPNAEQLNNRYNNKIYPYGNLRVLTELSEPLEIQKYTYQGNTPIKAMFPIIVRGETQNPIVSTGVKVKINEITISYSADTVINDIVDSINNAHVPHTNAYAIDGRLVIVSTNNSLKIQNVNGKFIQQVGFTTDQSKTELGWSADDLIETTIQAVLDEYLTIKHYNAKGDGLANDTASINDALLGTYCVEDAPVYLRTVYFPAGQYNVSEQLNIPCNARLLGEGKGRTIIKSVGNVNGNMIGFLDTEKRPSNADVFGGDGLNPHNITVEGFTFDGNNAVASIIEFINGSDITFRNCEFINVKDDAIKFKETQYENLHITLDNCDFAKNDTAINTGLADVKHLSVTNCHFTESNDQTIILGANTYKTNLINNCFMDTSLLAPEVLLIQGERTALVHSHFDDNIESFDTTPVPYTDETGTLYTDTINPNSGNKGMVYKFDYPLPYWGYVDQLQNTRGEYIIKPVYGDNDEEIVNWVFIKPGNTTNDNIEIYASDKFKDVYLNGGHYSNLIIGSSSDRYDIWASGVDYKIGDYVEYENYLYICVFGHRSNTYADLSNEVLWHKVTNLEELYIILAKNLDLNNKIITNTKGDITLKPSDNNVVIIDDENYAEKIDTIKNAVATVEFVKSNIANATISKYIDMTNYVPSEVWNRISMGTIDSASYGDEIYVKNITVSVESIFRQFNYASTVEWTPGTLCYKGTVYKHNGLYWVSKVSHADLIWDEIKWQEVNTNSINPASVRVYAQMGSNYIDLIPAGEVNLNVKEETYPESSTYNADTVVGNMFYHAFSRYVNIADFSLYIEITDKDGNLATNWQPSGRLFVTMDIFVK